MSKGPAIDLGTTNSAIALAEANGFEILLNTNGDRVTPSVVAFDGNDATVGREAANQAIQYPERTIFSVEQHMGTDEVILLGDENHKGEFTPEELSALILKRIKNDAETSLNRGKSRSNRPNDSMRSKSDRSRCDRLAIRRLRSNFDSIKTVFYAQAPRTSTTRSVLPSRSTRCSGWLPEIDAMQRNLPAIR